MIKTETFLPPRTHFEIIVLRIQSVYEDLNLFHIKELNGCMSPPYPSFLDKFSIFLEPSEKHVIIFCFILHFFLLDLFLKISKNMHKSLKNIFYWVIYFRYARRVQIHSSSIAGIRNANLIQRLFHLRILFHVFLFFRIL